MTPRHPALQAFLDRLAGMDEPTAKMLLEGIGHPGACRCNTCLQWWIACGDDSDWGPFTTEEITNATQGH